MHTETPLARKRQLGQRHPHLRPGERVKEYLLAEFEQPDSREGARLPTMRELAKRLNVGLTTVQGVFRQLAQEGRIRTQVGNGSFLVSPQTGKRRDLKIALNFPLAQNSETEQWVHRVTTGIFDSAARSPFSISVVPLPRQIDEPEAIFQKLEKERDEMDGLILLVNAPFYDRIRLAYEQAGKPVVTFNPPDESVTANFVTTGYFGASRKLGLAWKSTGRRHIALVTLSPCDHLVSFRLRCGGLVTGLGAQIGDRISFRIFEVPWGDQANGDRTTLPRILRDPSWTPDAIYCTHEILALEAVRAVRERGLRVPEDVSVVGAAGLDLSGTFCPNLTATRQPLEQIGEELLGMLCQRIEQRGAPQLGRVFPMPFVGGGTTRAEENALLDIQTASQSRPAKEGA